MEDADPEFAKKVGKGDIIVAGENFGSGSSREHAPIAIKYAGVSCVIAKSFARIFYRNAINTGLPIIEAPDAVDRIDEGDVLEVFLEKGIIQNLSKGEEYRFEPLPEFMMKLLTSGGLIPFVKERLASKGRNYDI